MAAMIRAARTIFSLFQVDSSVKLNRVHKKKRDIPGLANVNDIDTIRASLPQVRIHVNLEVLGAQVALSCEEHLNVLGGGVEDRGELRGGHYGRLI